MNADSTRMAWFLAVLGLLFLGSCERSGPTGADSPTSAGPPATAAPPPARLAGRTMGTTWTLLAVLPPGADQDSLARDVQALLDELENVFSHFRPDSELSRLNRSPRGAFVSEHMARVLACALRVHEQSDKALDVTVAPLVELWGFGPRRLQEQPPEPEQFRQVRSWVGSHLVRLELAASGRWHVRKLHPKLTLDLSAVAKGYAVDCVAALLDRAGVEHYLVGIGGEYRCRGRHPQGRPWRVGLEVPQATAAGTVYRQVVLRPGWAVATSGTYRQRRGQAHHIIDPRTARPATHRTVAVTVLAPRCMEADAWATALLVAGHEQGLPLARRHKLAAVFVVAQGQSWRVLATEQFHQAAPAR